MKSSRIRALVTTLYLFACLPGFSLAQVAPTNSATISGNVIDLAGNAVNSAEVVLSGPRRFVTHTDSHGSFVFIGVPFGSYQLSTQTKNFGSAAREMNVQGDVNVAIQFTAAALGENLKTIAHVSSSTNAEFNITPASITQANPQEEAFQGWTSWRKILEKIPGVAQAGVENIFVYGTIPDSPLMPEQFSIDGALPYETATLLDDMPLIGSSAASQAGSGTSLGMYPLNSFTSADIVRGPGAGAPSIVDSIGGSFLLHSPATVNQNQRSFSVSSDPYGGIVFNGLVAQKWNRLSATLTYGVNDSPGPVHSAEVTPVSYFFSNVPATVNGHLFIMNPPTCNPPGCALDFGFYPKLVNPAYVFGFYGTPATLLLGGVNGTSAWSQHGGSAEVNYEFSPSITAGIFYSGQTSLASQAYWSCFDQFQPPLGYTGAIPGGFASYSNTLRDPLTITQASSLLEEKVSAQLGVGVLRFAALQDRTYIATSYSLPATQTLQLYGGGLVCSNTNAGCSGGTYSQTNFNGGLYSTSFTSLEELLKNSSYNRDLLFEYTTSLGSSMRAGISFVQSTYNIPQLTVLSCGTPPFYSLNQSTSSSTSQTTRETRVFLGADPSEKTSLDLSMYFADADYHVPNPNQAIYPQPAAYVDERYTYAAPRLGFVWRPTASVAIRAAAGGGFAEAPLADLVGSNGSPVLSSGIYTQTLTNLNLQPERAFGFDIGSDFRLKYGTLLSVDLYRSNLFGQLYHSTALSGNYLGLPLYTTQYGNLGESRYEGVLVNLHHNVPHGIYWLLSGGLTRGYVVSLPQDFYNTAGGICNRVTGANCTNLAVVPNINFNECFSTLSIPYAQGLGTIGYRWTPNKYVELTGTYLGNNNTYFRPGFVEFDGQIEYPLAKAISMLITFRNITGIYDNPIASYGPEDFVGVPTITGLPESLNGTMYGPRAVVLTSQFHF